MSLFTFRWAVVVVVVVCAAGTDLQAQLPRALTEGMRLSNQISSALTRA